MSTPNETNTNEPKNREHTRKLGVLGVLSIVVGAAVVGVCAGVVSIYQRKATITRDVAAEMDAAWADVDEDELAWPLYQRATEMLPGVLPAGLLEVWPPRPGDDAWPRAERVLDENAEALDLIREAAARPQLGFPFVQEERLPLISVRVDYLTIARDFARYMVADARRAAAAGDADAFTADIETLAGLARHSAASKVLVGQLVEIAIAELTISTVAEEITRHPSLLDGEAAARVEAALAGMNDGEPYQLDLGGERLFWIDLAQRTYTDDGHGDGHVTLGGLRAMNEISDGSWVDEPLSEDSLKTRPSDLAMLPGAIMSPSRAELLAEVERRFEQMEAYSLVPPYQRTTPLPQTYPNGVLGPYEAMFPALASAGDNFFRVETRRSVTVAVLRALAEDGSVEPDDLPVDPFTGSALHVRPLHADGIEGVVVYSVGTDRDDDGGVATASDRDASLPTGPPTAGAVQADTGDWILWPGASVVEVFERAEPSDTDIAPSE